VKALITGASGFVAGHLARELALAGWLVDGVGIDVMEGVPSFRQTFSADVTDASAMRTVIADSEPDALFHLAGISSVGAAERDAATAYHVNCTGAVVTLRELDAYRLSSSRPVTALVVGSAEQYGPHQPGDLPLVEEATQQPVTTYAASKCAQEVAALQLGRSSGLRVVCTRSFNHSGAGQRPEFLLPALVRRALAVARGAGRSLAVGNTTPVRDYLHVEDVVRAYRLLVEKGTAGEVYNVCSGTGLSVEQIAGLVLRHVGANVPLEVQEKLVRPVDVPALVGANARLCRDTGWQAAKSFDDILEDLIFAASQ
jgi:GDP-4-dehydro-6-deoxy-D-mannose reductase